MRKARGLPDFAVIGAMRAGTTLLHDLLANTQGLCLARMKETDFFINEKNHGRGSDWYLRQFDNQQAICGEISPNYTKRDIFTGVPERLYAANPAAKLIYIVRDPVARAKSQYAHSWQMGQSLPAIDQFLDSPQGQHILDTSRYEWQLEPWLAVFPAENLLIIDFDDLINSPAQTVERIGLFVGLEQVIQNATDTDTNSSDALGSMPNWWLRLRQTRAANMLRTILPRDMVRKAKAIAQKDQPIRRAPVFSEDVLQQMAQLLERDIAFLNKISAGQPGPLAEKKRSAS